MAWLIPGYILVERHDCDQTHIITYIYKCIFRMHYGNLTWLAGRFPHLVRLFSDVWLPECIPTIIQHMNVFWTYWRFYLNIYIYTYIYVYIHIHIYIYTQYVYKIIWYYKLCFFGVMNVTDFFQDICWSFTYCFTIPAWRQGCLDLCACCLRAVQMLLRIARTMFEGAILLDPAGVNTMF
jgi:hypothetical protein